MRGQLLGMPVLILAVCGAIVSAAARRAGGQEAAPAAAEAIRFRRVYTPADHLNLWPRDNTRYLPMDKSEFESLVERARLQAAVASASAPQAIMAARYTARLSGDTLVDGEAVLEIAAPLAGASTVWLAPCGLAVSEASWLGEHVRPAVLAVGEDGRLGIRASGAGQLQVKWSLRGQPGMAGDVEFPVDLPACPSSHLVLALPKQFAPLVDGAVVIAEGSAGDGANRWRIDLGGVNRCRLRLVPRADLNPARKLTILRQALTYEFSPQGVELSAQWTLDVPSVPLRQLAIDLDPNLQLVAARYGGQPVAWSTVRAAGAHAATRVVLEFPEPIQGSGRVLRLGAIAPPPLGSRWRLPAMRAQGVFWQEGTATLIVPSPLTLESVAAQGGRQTQTGPLPAPQSGQMVDFQLFSPRASIEVVLARPESPLEFDCGTALEISGVDMAAEAIARFRLADGERFQIEAGISRLWTVDSVETSPANALEDWAVLKGGAGRRRLVIRLAKPLDAARPLEVSVKARHHYSPLGRVLGRDDLAPIEFRGSSEGRRLVSIRAAEAYQPRVSGDQRLARVDPQSLTPADLELFDNPPKGLVFLNDPQAAPVQIALEPHKPSYSATIQVEATATDAGLSESYAIRCVPEAARVDRLLVQFSQTRSVPLHWTFGAEEQDQATVRPWKPSGRPAAASGGEWFEIAFRRPRSVPFEIRAARTLPFLGPVSVGLASLPQSARQSGTVSIGSTRTDAVQVQPHHLTPIPPAPIPGNQYSTVRARYRYDPAHDVGPGSEAAVVLIPQPTRSATPWAWAWTCHIDSRYETNGTAHHAVTYRLQNAGRSRILLGLPENIDADAIRGIWVDGTRVPRETTAEGGGRWLSVPLPPGRKFPVVSLVVATSAAPLGWIDSLKPILPQLDVPVLRTHWTAWLPPGYQSAVPSLPGERPWRAAKTVAQRLFGRWGQTAQTSRFRPWAAEDWTRLDPRRSELALARQNAASLLDRLGAAEPTPPPATEGSHASPASPKRVWIEQLTRAAAGIELPVLVDRVALARAGVQPREPLPPRPQGSRPQTSQVSQASEVSGMDRGLALLGQAGLALVLSRDAVLVTGAADTVSYRASLVPTGLDNVWQALPGPLAEHLAQAAESGQDPMLVPLEIWGRLEEPSGDLWARPPAAGHGPGETLGWSAYDMELSGEDAAKLPVVRADTLRALGWSLLVGVFALLAWTARGRPVLLVVLATLAALTALVAPEAFTAPASGVLWAVLGVMAMEWILPRPATISGNSDPTVIVQRPPMLMTAVRTGIILLWMASAWAWCGAARGEPAGGSSGPTYQVLIPIDDKQQPTGDKYYVPESLFSQLQAAASSRSDDRRGWVLQSAVYRGALSWQTAPEELVLEELRATFDLEVFGRQVRVRIPLGRSGIELLPDGVSLEGRNIQPVWPDAEGNMAFDVREPGRYRLELAARPTSRTVGDKTVIEWKIPRLATSRLELTVPPDAPNVELPTAMGAVAHEADSSRLLVSLGPTDQLQIAWPEAAARLREGLAADVEQLLWLKIRPGSVVLDTLLNFRVLEGRLREVQLTLDPRLRYFPATAGRSPVAQMTTDLGEPQHVRLKLSQPATDKVGVPVTFLLQEGSGVGHYRLPLFDVVGAQTTKRWLAVSVDPSLEHSQSGAEDLQSVSVSAFMAAWGAGKPPPLAAWELPSPRPDWSVSTRPVPPRTTAEQRLTLNFADRSARAVLEAAVTVSGQAVFQQRIAAPPELEIERISLVDDGAERVARWSRAADGTTTVFLNGPSIGKQQLTLVGRLPTPQQGKFPLPIVRLEAEPAKPMEIAVFREPSVQVQVSDSAGLVEIQSSAGDESRTPPARLVKAFRVQPAEAAKADLWIAPNRPNVRAEQITWVRSLADAWQLDVDFRFKITGGPADQFRFDIPPQWAGPYKVQPPAAVNVIDVPGKLHRQLVVRPRTAVEGDYRLSISSPLKLAAGERPSAVKIVPEKASVSKHVVILPVSSQFPPMRWETHGLTETKLPGDAAVPPAQRGGFAAYRVIAEDYLALLCLGDEDQGKPQVDLADVRIACQADGSFHALAAMDLDPAGLASCPVTLPSGCRLVQVLVAGQSVLAAAVGENRWRIPLGSSLLPQRIEVLFAGRISGLGGTGAAEFPVPSLGEIPVRQSVWTVSAPEGYRLRANDPLDSLTPLQHAVMELRTATALVERVAQLPGVEGEALGRWYRGWSARWLAARASAVRELARLDAASETASVQAEVESLEERQAAASERLGLSELMSQAAADRAPGDELAATWLSTEESRRAVIQYGTGGAPSSIAVVCRQPATPQSSRRLLAALAVAILGLAATWGTARSLLARFFLHRPYIAGMAIGLAWWWLLEPSALGFAVAVICAAAALWSHRRCGARFQRAAAR